MILLNDFKRQWLETGEATLAAVRAVGESGWYILGEEVRALEAALAKSWGLGHCVGVASGLDAIELGLQAMGCRPGDRVLTTPLSAFATTLAIVKLGAVPVFTDTDASGLLDLELAAAQSDIKFAVPVHLYGHALDLDRIARLPFPVLEDCAQSIGAKHKGRLTGTAGVAAATSFYPTKNFGALGDGGALLTHDLDLSECVRSLGDYGQSAKYRHTRIGSNSRLDELQAAILRRAHLPMLETWTARRQAIASRYMAELNSPAVRPLPVPDGSESCWHLFPVLVDPDRKAGFMAHLKSRGVSSGEHYPVLIPDQPALAGVPHEIRGSLHNARRIASSEVSLPIHPYLTDEEAVAVIAACRAWQG